MGLPDVPDHWIHPPDLAHAARLQRLLAAKVSAEPLAGPVRTIAGVDVSHFPRDPSGRIWAAVVVLDARTLAPLAEATALRIAPIPYVPGYLGFREVPALLAAFAQLTIQPDLVLADGHGISHPRGLGIAAHLGVLTGLPTIGAAKSILVGQPAAALPVERGASVPLVWQGREIGAVLRTRRGVSPIYVSVGHRVSLGQALEWTLRLATRYRLPEPTRRAHAAANAARRGNDASAAGQ